MLCCSKASRTFRRGKCTWCMRFVHSHRCAMHATRKRRTWDTVKFTSLSLIIVERVKNKRRELYKKEPPRRRWADASSSTGVARRGGPSDRVCRPNTSTAATLPAGHRRRCNDPAIDELQLYNAACKLVLLHLHLGLDWKVIWRGRLAISRRSSQDTERQKYSFHFLNNNNDHNKAHRKLIRHIN